MIGVKTLSLGHFDIYKFLIFNFLKNILNNTYEKSAWLSSTGSFYRKLFELGEEDP